MTNFSFFVLRAVVRSHAPPSKSLAPSEWFAAVDAAQRIAGGSLLRCRAGVAAARVKEMGFVSARDRATGEMSVVARERARADRRKIATWSFRPSCEWMSRRSLPNKMSLDSGSVGF
jgi:hypothetical protein